MDAKDVAIVERISLFSNVESSGEILRKQLINIEFR
jgi:hypothetical protein